MILDPLSGTRRKGKEPERNEKKKEKEEANVYGPGTKIVPWVWNQDQAKKKNTQLAPSLRKSPLQVRNIRGKKKDTAIKSTRIPSYQKKENQKREPKENQKKRLWIKYRRSLSSGLYQNAASTK